MLFSYNRNVNLPFIKIGNDKINETFVTKFLGVHFDKKLKGSQEHRLVARNVNRGIQY